LPLPPSLPSIATLGVLALAALSATDVRAAEPSWLPPQVESGAAEQLAGRLNELGRGKADTGETLAEARKLVRSMRDVVDSWGVARTLANAPKFDQLQLPPAAESYLDAMQRYQICNVLLFRQTVHPDFADDFNARFTGTLGLTAVTLAVVRLREPFLAAGGSPEQIEAQLTSSDLEKVSQRIQTDEASRSHAEQQCQPLLLQLLEVPLQEFNARHQ